MQFESQGNDGIQGSFGVIVDELADFGGQGYMILVMMGFMAWPPRRPGPLR